MKVTNPVDGWMDEPDPVAMVELEKHDPPLGQLSGGRFMPWVLLLLITLLIPLEARASEGSGRPGARGCASTAAIGPDELPQGWRIISGKEPWLAPGEAESRGLLGCPYYEYVGLPAKGPDSVCPSNLEQRSDQVARFVKVLESGGRAVHLIVDGSEDSMQLDERLTERITRLLGAGQEDLRVFVGSIRWWRAIARAECVRQQLISALPGSTVLLGTGRTRQAQERRGAIVYAVARPKAALTAAPRSGPSAASAVETAKRTNAAGSPQPKQEPAPAESDHHLRIGPEVWTSYVLAAENTRFWSPSSIMGIGVVVDGLGVGPFTAAAHLGYSFNDAKTEVRILSRDLPEHVQQHALAGTFELKFVPRLRLGLKGQASLIRETLNPGGNTSTSRLLFGAAAGPTAAFSLLESPNATFRVDLRYECLFIAMPPEEDGAIGRVHVLGPSVLWSP